MFKQVWQCFFVVLFVVTGSAGADQTKSNEIPLAKPVNPSKIPQVNPVTTKPEPAAQPAPAPQPAPPPPPPFKFSIPYQQMRDNPRKAQEIVEKELAPDAAAKRNAEMEARQNLGAGFESMGDFDSAAKNFSRCRLLFKNTDEDGNLATVCLLGLARVARLSTAGLPLGKLYELRNDPLMSGELRIQFFVELISSYSFHRDFVRARQLVTEAESSLGNLKAIDQYLLRYNQTFMLIDAKDFVAAEANLKLVRPLATKLGPQLEAWVDHMEGNYFLGKKDFVRAKSSYQKALPVIGTKGFRFNAFWVHYLGLKIGYYLGDQTLVSSSFNECTQIIRGTEVEQKFIALINAWVKLQKRDDINSDLMTLNKIFGPNKNLVEELNVAKAWQKPK